MFIIDTKLKERQQKGIPIHVGVIGAGDMGSAFIHQVECFIPGMRIAAVFNRTPSKVTNCFKEIAKTGEMSIVFAKSGDDVDDAIREDRFCCASEPSCLWMSKSIDVIVDMTGCLHPAFEWTVSSLKAGKRFVSFSAELDATIGPYLHKIAKENKTHYTLGDGDQPGTTLNLYRHVRMLGLKPLVCGNVKGFLNHHRTPSDQKAWAMKYGLNSVSLVTSATDGTKIALEQASIANATGMRVAKRGMIGLNHNGHIDDLRDSYDVDQLEALGGIVEMVVGAEPGPGVFVFAKSEDPLNVRFLKYTKMGEGPLYSFYVPHHLIYMELPFSIARLVDFDDGTVDGTEFRVEVIAVAKKNMKAGDILDGIGGYTHYGMCENTEIVRKEILLPSGLAEGKILVTDVSKDCPITWIDVKGEKNPLPLEEAYFSFLKNSKVSVRP